MLRTTKRAKKQRSYRFVSDREPLLVQSFECIHIRFLPRSILRDTGNAQGASGRVGYRSEKKSLAQPHLNLVGVQAFRIVELPVLDEQNARLVKIFGEHRVLDLPLMLARVLREPSCVRPGDEEACRRRSSK